MNEELVTEARALLDRLDRGPFPIAAEVAFEQDSARLVRGLLAEVERLHAERLIQAGERAQLIAAGDAMGLRLAGVAGVAEPRCLCTHRWAEHYGTRTDAHPERGCQRPGCECRAFVEPEDDSIVCPHGTNWPDGGDMCSSCEWYYQTHGPDGRRQ